MQFPSKQQLDSSKKTFTILPHDDYELVISKIEPKTQQKYQKPDETEDVVNMTLEVQALRDGSEPFDIKGESAVDRKVFFTLRPNSLGYKQDGTPSKSRELLAYSTGQDIDSELGIENWEVLLGKTVYAEVGKKQNSKGEDKNIILRFLLPPKRTS